jgi:membrane protein implicated in regulation of membrane protease activity
MVTGFGDTLHNDMANWLAWLIGAGLLLVGEIATLSFILGPVAIAALVAALAAGLGASIAIQIVAFIAGSLAGLAFIRPIARRHLRTPARLKSGTAALVGQEALVLEAVNGTSGRIKLAGEVWSARSYDTQSIIEPGARVHVMKIEGATALVAE